MGSTILLGFPGIDIKSVVYLSNRLNKMIQVQVKELLKALLIVKPGLAKKEVIEQSTSFALMNGKVVTYNDDITITHPVEGLNITCAIEAELFYKFLQKVKKDSVEIELTDKALKIVSGRMNATFRIDPEIVLPIENLKRESHWKPLPANFVDGLKFVTPIAKNDIFNPIFEFINITKAGYLESSDTKRIARYKTEPLPIDTFLLPKTSAEQVIKINPVKIAFDKTSVHFRNEAGTVIGCRTY